MSVTLAPRARMSGERGMAGRVDEGDLGARGRSHLIGADMLGNAARFAGYDVGLADGVEHRGLAVIDMAHDRDDRRPGARRFSSSSVTPPRPISTSASLTRLTLWPNSSAISSAGIGVDGLVDRGHDSHSKQCLDDLGAARRHTARQFLDGDRLGNDDVANDLLRIVLQCGALFLLFLLTGGVARRPGCACGRPRRPTRRRSSACPSADDGRAPNAEPAPGLS